MVVPRHRMWLVSLCGPALAADLVVNRKNYLSMQAAARSRRRCALLTRCPAMVCPRPG